MAVPIPGIREDYSETELRLYLPFLSTSPAIPQAGNSYLSNMSLKDVSVKSLYLERGSMEASPEWDGTKNDWSSGVTEIQTDFINAGDDNNGNFNLLKKLRITQRLGYIVL